MRPVVWAIGGSDSGGGAGLQADVRTISGLAAHACNIVTAVTAQNSLRVEEVWPVPEPAFVAQWKAVASDIPPAAIKIGMLGTEALVTSVARRLEDVDAPVILDPVLRASSGGSLLEPSARETFLRELLPRATIFTPNLEEAATLLRRDRPLRTAAEIESAAHEFASRGVPAVVIKGGHGGGAFAHDCILHAGRVSWLTNERLATAHTHGTGCTFASAIAAAMAHGLPPVDAIVVAKMFVTAAIRNGYAAGAGAGPVAPGGWPESPQDLPWLTRTMEEGVNRLQFPPIERPLGLYAIVDSADWVERCVAIPEITTIQLRVKNSRGAALREEIARAVRVARAASVPLFVNDYWQLAIEEKAFGVHLGQEDLDSADASAIAHAGLRLGISTHCHEEVARAHALRPSYIAVGPVFETKIKVMRFAPQGIAALRRWRSILAGYPIVAIGGIDAGNVHDVVRAGADSVAVIRAITLAADPSRSARELAAALEHSREIPDARAVSSRTA